MSKDSIRELFREFAQSENYQLVDGYFEQREDGTYLDDMVEFSYQSFCHNTRVWLQLYQIDISHFNQNSS